MGSHRRLGGPCGSCGGATLEFLPNRFGCLSCYTPTDPEETKAMFELVRDDRAGLLEEREEREPLVCDLCESSEVEPAWRCVHGDGARWHHRIDPGDGLTSDCRHGRLFELAYSSGMQEARRHDPECDVFDIDPAIGGSTNKPCNCHADQDPRAQEERRA